MLDLLLRYFGTWSGVFAKRSGWSRNAVTARSKLPRNLGGNELRFRGDSTGNTVEFGSAVTLKNLKIVFKGTNSRLVIGNDVRLTGHIEVVGTKRTVTIGNGTTAQGLYILCRGADVTIGSDCMFSREIEVRSTDVHTLHDLATGKRLNHPAPVVIENHVWVAARAFISKGARIPEGCIIGACSFVNGAFDEANTVIAGTPAKIVRRNIAWKR